MDFIKNISIVFMVALLILLAMIALIRNEWMINKSLYFGIMIALFASVVVYVYCFDIKPIARWDLLQHYRTIGLMKENGWNFVWTKGEYKDRYVISLYFYLISFMPDYRLVPVIPLIIEFSIALYLFEKSMKVYEVNDAYPVADAAFTTLAWFATFGIKLAVSGVRCVWAVSLCALAIYWEAIRKEHRLVAYGLYIIAYGIHDFALVLILVRLLMMIKDKRLLAVCVFLGMTGLSAILPVLYRMMPNPSLRRIYRYWTNSSILSFIKGRSISELSVILCMIFVMLYYAYVNYSIFRKLDTADKGTEICQRNLAELQIIEFTSTLAVVAVAACYLYVFTERLLYLVAYGFLLCIPYYRKMKANNVTVDALMLFIMLWLWFFNDIYPLMVNETGVYFLAQ